MMKPLLTLLVAITWSNVVLAQATTYGNFRIEDQQLIFQKIFPHDSITLDKLAAFYSAQPLVSRVVSSPSQIEFDVHDFVVDYKKFGFSQVSTPPVIQTGRFFGHVTVSVRDGKYRITVRDITFTGDLGYRKVTTADKLTSYACRDNGTYISPDWTKPNTLGLLDKALTDKLQYVEPRIRKEDSDW